MEIRDLSHEDQKAIEQALGYLNLSSGGADPRFLANLNRVFARAAGAAGDRPLWRAAWDLLETELRRLSLQ